MFSRAALLDPIEAKTLSAGNVTSLSRTEEWVFSLSLLMSVLYGDNTNMFSSLINTFSNLPLNINTFSFDCTVDLPIY